MKLIKIVFVITGIVVLVLFNNVAQSATLKAGKKVFLTKEGDGPWDLKVLRRPDNTVAGWPNGEAVDNNGNIYINDTFGNRILVFTPEGKPWKIITHKDLYHPLDISVDEDNTIFVNSVIRGKGEDIQYIISFDGRKWNFKTLGKVQSIVANVINKEIPFYDISEFPHNEYGVRYVISPVPTDKPILLFNKNNKYIKSVPSSYFDKKGRYYTYSMERKKRVIVDEDGNILGEFNSGGSRKLKYRGWIYFVEKLNGKWSLLRRYGEDGTVEHEIKVDATGKLLISPDNKFVFLRKGNSFKGIWITRLTYHED